MKSNSPLFKIISLLLMFGPIVLFWYVDWYWIVGYYNLFFAYTCYTLYKQYDLDSNYKRKFHVIIYVGLPLIFSFIGLLVSVLNGFEEIRDEDKNFNSDLTKKIDEDQIESKSDVHVSNKEFIEDLGRLYNTIDKDKFQKEAFKRWRDFFEKQLDDFFSDWEEDGSFHDDYDLLISEKDDYYIESFYNTHEYKSDKIEIVDFLIRNRNVEIELDHLPVILPVIFYNEEPYIIYNFPYNYNDSSNFIGNHFSFYIDGGLLEVCEKLSKLKMKDFKEEIPKNAKKINNEKDLIQELGRIYDLLGHKEYKKEAYNLWRDFFLKKYDESEEKDGWEIGQEANSVMFDMYEVDFVSFFLNNKESGDTETMDIRFPFKILENGKAALIYNFPFKYDQITSHSSGSFYQLDDVWGSLNEVCKSLSELELLDINKLSQVQKNELFTPQRKDYK